MPCNWLNMCARTHISWKQHVGREAAQAWANQTNALVVASNVAAVSTQSTQQIVQLAVSSATAAVNPHIQQQIEQIECSCVAKVCCQAKMSNSI